MAESNPCEMKWRFGVVGNIVSEHTDESEGGRVYHGTKAFSSGTKVYIDGKRWTPERTEVSVIGRNRFGRVVLETVPLNLIENIRTQRIYKPHVLEIMEHLSIVDGWEWWNRTAADRKETEQFVQAVKELLKQSARP